MFKAVGWLSYIELGRLQKLINRRCMSNDYCLQGDDFGKTPENQPHTTMEKKIATFPLAKGTNQLKLFNMYSI